MKKYCKEIRVGLSERTAKVVELFARDLGVPKAFVVRCAISSYLSRKGAYAKYEINQETK